MDINICITDTADCIRHFSCYVTSNTLSKPYHLLSIFCANSKQESRCDYINNRQRRLRTRTFTRDQEGSFTVIKVSIQLRRRSSPTYACI